MFDLPVLKFLRAAFVWTTMRSRLVNPAESGACAFSNSGKTNYSIRIGPFYNDAEKKEIYHRIANFLLLSRTLDPDVTKNTFDYHAFAISIDLSQTRAPSRTNDPLMDALEYFKRSPRIRLPSQLYVWATEFTHATLWTLSALPYLFSEEFHGTTAINRIHLWAHASPANRKAGMQEDELCDGLTGTVKLGKVWAK